MKRFSTKFISFWIALILLIPFFSLQIFSESKDVSFIQSGKVYYIRNVYSGRYLHVSDGTDANGQNVITYTFNRTQAQKWRVVRNNDGTYTLFSLVGNARRALDISDFIEKNIDIFINDYKSLQSFRLIGTNGVFRIVHTYIGQNRYISENSTTHNVYLADSRSDMIASWTFELADKGSASIYSLSKNPVYCDTSILDLSTKLSYCNYKPYGYDGTYVDTAFYNMKEDQIAIFITHGSNGKLAFYHNNVSANSWLCPSTQSINFMQGRDCAISEYDDFDLSGLKCVLYMACESGKNAVGSDGVSCNLLNKTIEKGALLAIGVRDSVGFDLLRGWPDQFLLKAKSGATAKECIVTANDAYSSYYENIDNIIRVSGNQEQRIK